MVEIKRVTDPGQGLLSQKQTCALCGGTLYVPPRATSRRYDEGKTVMRRHLTRCRRATAEERSYFRAHRRWPSRK